MQVLTPRVDLAQFMASISAAPSRVLMLDYDGTLAPFNIRPDQAALYPEVRVALEHILEAGGTRVVIVSGRPANELLPLLPLAHRPEIWGSHGWERLLPDGRRVVEEPVAAAGHALDRASVSVCRIIPDGARLEKKLASIALHWRGLPEALAQSLTEQASATWQPFLRTGLLELLPFDGGLELRAVGCNKQFAVKAVLAESEERCAVAYLGDDVTDEDAFRAVRVRGIGVLVRMEFRPTEADVWLQPPHELVAFLEHWRVRSGTRSR